MDLRKKWGNPLCEMRVWKVVDVRELRVARSESPEMRGKLCVSREWRVERFNVFGVFSLEKGKMILEGAEFSPTFNEPEGISVRNNLRKKKIRVNHHEVVILRDKEEGAELSTLSG
ncbi:hypothetical protein COLO4_08416 [Corchorus olitorius]|uniref:Uncharacterized protein n=1 Tax=Corchorus olitorius TaxID=93759 RepID=A0A1R3KFV0_9ROSI|nr:hypothetical protein COLO4_08416 [Corchorus olitorius]